MASLPPELAVDILLVLPVKSFLRFRCVSKSFYALIKSKYFIYSHIRTSFEKRIHRKLIFLDSYNHTDIHAFDINNGSVVEKVLLDFEFPYKNGLFVASCNGLVLLKLSGYKFSIWNPSTRNSRELPAFLVNFPESSDWRNSSSGFGYDSSTDDYKIIQIIPTKPSYQVWIFELRSSSWRRIQDFPYVEYADIHKAKEGICFVEGYVHFLCYRKRRESHIIAAFDVSKETFSVVDEPIYENENQGKHICLKAFEGCLSITAHTQKKVVLYVRRKEGIEFTWTKLFYIKEEQFCPRTLGYSKEGDHNNKVLLLSCGNIYSYDLEERILEKIETNVLINNLDLFNYIFCVESLVSIYYSIKEEAQVMSHDFISV